MYGCTQTLFICFLNLVFDVSIQLDSADNDIAIVRLTKQASSSIFHMLSAMPLQRRTNCRTFSLFRY